MGGVGAAGEGGRGQPAKAAGSSLQQAISASGHTRRGRVRQKPTRQAELQEVGRLRSGPSSLSSFGHIVNQELRAELTLAAFRAFC